eukprot:10384578-Lingulodinium_polyedra.AAC.1
MGHMPRSSSAVWDRRASCVRTSALAQAAQRSYPSGCCPCSEAFPFASPLGARSLHSRQLDFRAFSQTATLPARGSR